MKQDQQAQPIIFPICICSLRLGFCVSSQICSIRVSALHLLPWMKRAQARMGHLRIELHFDLLGLHRERLDALKFLENADQRIFHLLLTEDAAKTDPRTMVERNEIPDGWLVIIPSFRTPDASVGTPDVGAMLDVEN